MTHPTASKLCEKQPLNAFSFRSTYRSAHHGEYSLDPAYHFESVVRVHAPDRRNSDSTKLEGLKSPKAKLPRERQWSGHVVEDVVIIDNALETQLVASDTPVRRTQLDAMSVAALEQLPLFICAK